MNQPKETTLPPDAIDPSERISSDDESLDDLDKSLADSFPASDAPSMP